MALQIWTPFRAADYTFQGGAAFGAGIGHGLESMGQSFARRRAQDRQSAHEEQMLEKRHEHWQELEDRRQKWQDFTHEREQLEKEIEEQKSRAARGKAADAFFKASPDFAKRVGMTAEEWALLAPDDKVGAMEGAIKAQAFAEGIREGESRAAILKAQQEQAANLERFPAFAAALSEYGQRREDLPEWLGDAEIDRRTSALDFSKVMEASRLTGYRPNLSEVDDIMRAVGGGQHNRTPEEMELGGRTVIFNRQTGQFQVLSDPKEVKQMTGELLPVRRPGTNEIIPGVGMNPVTGRIHDLRTGVEKAGLGDDGDLEPKPGFWSTLFGSWGASKASGPAKAPAKAAETNAAPDEFDFDAKTGNLVPRNANR